MNAIPKTLIRHEGLQLLLYAMLFSLLAVITVPEDFMKLDNRQKKELLKNRIRRLRRKSENLFDLDDDEDECN